MDQPQLLYEAYLENTSNGHNKYYRVKVMRHGDKWVTFGEYGKIGCKVPNFVFSDAKNRCGTFSSAAQARQGAEDLVWDKKWNKGYRLISEEDRGTKWDWVQQLIK